MRSFTQVCLHIPNTESKNLSVRKCDLCAHTYKHRHGRSSAMLLGNVLLGIFGSCLSCGCYFGVHDSMGQGCFSKKGGAVPNIRWVVIMFWLIGVWGFHLPTYLLSLVAFQWHYDNMAIRLDIFVLSFYVVCIYLFIFLRVLFVLSVVRGFKSKLLRGKRPVSYKLCLWNEAHEHDNKWEQHLHSEQTVLTPGSV